MGISKNTQRLIGSALREDAPYGDITSRYFGNPKTPAQARLVAKADGIICGLEIAQQCFTTVARQTVFHARYCDGAKVKKGTLLATIKGRLNDLLLAERTALNLLQHLSGVATETDKLVKLLGNNSAKLLDTRKTIPGLRELEKYAVVCGGGCNHRLNLSDMVLIKDNHLAKLSFAELQQRVQKFRRTHKERVEVEAASLAQVKKFLKLPVHIIMLDNMSVPQIKQAVKLRDRLNPQCQLEASGNVSAKTISALAKTGVDYISCGKITHSAPALDISMLIK